MNKYRLWDENGFNYVIETNATKGDFLDAMAHVEENVENYDNESIVERLEEQGFKVIVHDEIPEENCFYWG
jgi:hypothetical protein